MSLQYNSSRTDHDFTTLLEGATKDELQELIENEDKVNELICDHEQVSVPNEFVRCLTSGDR